MNIRLPLFLFVGMLFFSSCEKELMTEEEKSSTTEETTKDDADSKLTIVTRAPSGEVISLPISVYIMNAEGTCLKKEVLEALDDELSVKLSAGTYQVYAIGGATENAYVLPDASSATAITDITLKNGALHGDLMTASNTIQIGRNESNTLVMSFTRKVLKVTEVTINDIPTAATAVSVSMNPLYKSIRLNGDYVAATETATIVLARQNDGTTWKNATAVNLLPAVDAVTVTVRMTLNGETKAYTYTTSQALEANHELSITGSYTGNAGEFTMSGEFTGAVWGEPTNISFTFNESGAEDAGSSQGSGGGSGGTGDGDAPDINTWYKNCFVFMSAEDGNDIVITLLHPSEVEVTDAENKSLADINTLIQAFDNNGVTGWRLPTETEAKAIHANLVNGQVEQNGGSQMANGERYFYEKDDYSLGAFFGTGDIAFSLTPTMYLRPVTTLSFKKQ